MKKMEDKTTVKTNVRDNEGLSRGSDRVLREVASVVRN